MNRFMWLAAVVHISESQVDVEAVVYSFKKELQQQQQGSPKMPWQQYDYSIGQWLCLDSVQVFKVILNSVVR